MRSFSIEAALAAILLSTAGASAASSPPSQTRPKFDLVVRKEKRNHAVVAEASPKHRLPDRLRRPHRSQERLRQVSLSRLWPFFGWACFDQRCWSSRNAVITVEGCLLDRHHFEHDCVGLHRQNTPCRAAAPLAAVLMSIGHLVDDHVHDKLRTKFAAIEGAWHHETAGVGGASRVA